MFGVILRSMWRSLRVPFIAILVCAASACDDDASASDDAGRVWNPRDAGIPPRVDAGTDSDGGGYRVCYALPEVAEFPRCRAVTSACVDACPMDDTADACHQACWTSDTYPRSGGSDDIGCIDCVFRQVLRCINDVGCDAEIAAYLCCIIDNCSAPGSAPDCADTMCVDENQAMFTCGYVRDPTCFDLTDGYIGMCYSEEDPDAGPLDAGGALDALVAVDAGSTFDASVLFPDAAGDATPSVDAGGP